MRQRRNLQNGFLSGSMFAVILLSILTVLFAGLSIWLFVQYDQKRTDVDGQISNAVAEARKEQADADEKKFLERENQPMRQFVGPDDYGRLTFDYPKTWSAYQNADISVGGGVTYDAYLHPILVPPVKTRGDVSKFALSVTIVQENYDEVLASYDDQIRKGELQSAAWSNGHDLSGTRLTGNFTKDIRGTAILVKMRDRTLTLRTDADVFRDYFEEIIKTLKFNQ